MFGERETHRFDLYRNFSTNVPLGVDTPRYKNFHTINNH
jgi:hypothetical protein